VTCEISQIAVVVPARNEQALLPACLDALALAADTCAVPVRVMVVAAQWNSLVHRPSVIGNGVDPDRFVMGPGGPHLAASRAFGGGGRASGYRLSVRRKEPSTWIPSACSVRRIHSRWDSFRDAQVSAVSPHGIRQPGPSA
jgi:hypothetical protein